MKIGIIVAMEEELNSIKKYMNNVIEETIFDITFYKGYINNVDAVLVKSGIGKVNAARTTQLLIDHEKVSYIINIGVAGGVSSKVNVGDIIVGKFLVQHDFDITAFGHERGYITGVGKYIYSDSNLVRIFANEINKKDYNILLGGIASGDIFCNDKDLSLSIQKEFDVDCVEMEGAAIAQVCFLSKIPFVIIRSISDVVNGNNEVDFEQFLNSSSQVVADLLFNNINKID